MIWGVVGGGVAPLSVGLFHWIPQPSSTLACGNSLLESISSPHDNTHHSASKQRPENPTGIMVATAFKATLLGSCLFMASGFKVSATKKGKSTGSLHHGSGVVCWRLLPPPPPPALGPCIHTEKDCPPTFPSQLTPRTSTHHCSSRFRSPVARPRSAWRRRARGTPLRASTAA